jgi:hypothetical protein
VAGPLTEINAKQSTPAVNPAAMPQTVTNGRTAAVPSIFCRVSRSPIILISDTKAAGFRWMCECAGTARWRAAAREYRGLLPGL